MPASTFDYVYFPGGGPHSRQPRASGNIRGFVPIPGESGPGPWAEQYHPFTFPPGSLPPTWIVDGLTYSFSFVNVSGGIGGGQTSFDRTAPPQPLVGASPIVVLAVYVYDVNSVPGPGVPGASIDAFDETKGILIDDDFVTVSPDANLSSSGNKLGWVPTIDNAETIAAYNHIVRNGADFVDFENWVDLAILPSLPPPGLDFKAAQGQSYNALAFYKSPPPPPPPPPPNRCEALLQALTEEIKAFGGVPIATHQYWISAFQGCPASIYNEAMLLLEGKGRQEPPSGQKPPR